jgi:DNA-binding NarL/FixJ family response regulator
VAAGLTVAEPGWLQPAAEKTPEALLEPLTAREQEVLPLLAEGLSNKAIAAQLQISEHTAKFHVNAVLTKLGAQNRVEAVVRAARIGLLSL